MSAGSLPRENAAAIPAIAPAPQPLRDTCLLAGSQILLWTGLAAACNAVVPLVLTARLFWTQDFVRYDIALKPTLRHLWSVPALVRPC